ncbi:glucose dehydrogenase [FAD, quinone]-like [Periplaneta americana]|uniref:glucose dehydrogenase [FAD, quinone]-like n=1 Tax=Periplaneta americana TaxID=6978 RepID=UPI0037E99EDB
MIRINKTQSAVYIAFWTLLLFYLDALTTNFMKPPQYDFIIVGGGTAGCLLAARLSEIPEWNVLLLEAGGEETFLHDIPLLAPLFILSPSSWGYMAERNDTFGLGLRDGRLIWPRGKVLGGSSVINAMIYTRGNRRDFDYWEELGNTNWSYDKVLPYFLKHEKINIPELFNDTKYHSREGNLEVTYPPHSTLLSTAFVNAGIEKGYGYIDYNAADQIGFSHIQTTTKNGSRFSSYRAFLESVKDRKNLRIRTRSFVTKILIDSDNKTAYGVEYTWYWLLPLRAHARKEVILSGGSTNSPQLLMLSGIGPKEHLRKLDIPVIVDSKVGHNLQDHVSLLSLFFTVNSSVDIRLRKPIHVVGSLTRYFMEGAGEFTTPSGFEAISFLDVGNDSFSEIELFFSGQLLPAIPLYLSRFGVLSDSFNKFYKPLKSLHGFTILPILLRPYSAGKLELKDKRSHSHPLIYPNYFSDSRDMAILIKAIKMAVGLLETRSFKKYGAQLYREPLPPCKGHEFQSDEYWECAIRYTTVSIQHSVGTCKMGPDYDPDAVVDPRLRVRGIDRLRVVDASIMPSITSGHTMAPVYMIAEKAADMIKTDWTEND